LIIGALKDTPVLDKGHGIYVIVFDTGGHSVLHRSLHSGILSAWNIIHSLIGSSYGYRACYDCIVVVVLQQRLDKI
jgi:hypothetical protein